ncbi:MAG: PLP-dependent transferase [Acidimicrobiales bacterium]
MAGFDTRCVHGAGPPDPATGAVVPPISLATTFAQDGVGGHRGYEYSRTGNPTRATLERHIAALEGARHGLAFASGLAAEDAVLRLLAPGDHLLIPDDAYGGTFRLAVRVHEPAGLAITPVDLTDLDAVRAAWRPTTRLVWVETPTNPLLRIVDIEAVASVAHESRLRGAERNDRLRGAERNARLRGAGRNARLRGAERNARLRGAERNDRALVAVDNTFATPALQQPLTLGADIVVHSSTKYLGGHSDVVGGFVATNDDELGERLAFLQNAVGAVPGPLDCYLVHRGARTLHVRMERHGLNAAAIAELLQSHAAVRSVLWPGLSDHPGHDVAKRQMSGFGGMVSFRLAGGEPAALAVCERTELFTLAESLGAVESLIEHPGRMTHASTAGTSNEVPADLVRLSIGIEDAGDLVADLRQALDSLA